MDHRLETNHGHIRHAFICRDALDGRLIIEDQVYRGEKLASTTLVATVTPSDAEDVLRACQARLDVSNDAGRRS